MRSPPRRAGSRARWQAEYDLFLGRLRDARAETGMTQRQAAAKLGRSHSFLAKSEAGERRVDIVELTHFARLYGRPLAWFAPWLRDAS